MSLVNSPSKVSGIVVRVSRLITPERSVAVYQKWQIERWNYWKCRFFLKSLIRFFEFTGITFDGISIEKSKLDSLINNDVLVVDALKGAGTWHPEDYISRTSHTAKEVEEYEAFDRFYTELRLEEIPTYRKRDAEYRKKLRSEDL